MTTTPAHKPAGTPAGGQFTGIARHEPDLQLGAPTPGIGPEEIRDWVAAQASHHLSPIIGWIRRDAAQGKDTSGYVASFHERAGRLADDVARRFAAAPEDLRRRVDATNTASEAIHAHLEPLFSDLTEAAGDNTRLAAARWRAQAKAAAEEISGKVTAPAPVLEGFTAAEVEDRLARDQHDRVCACDLPDDVCRSESYGESWRHRMGVPDIEGIFDTIQEMASARDGK